jgi:hypothetical protein
MISTVTVKPEAIEQAFHALGFEDRAEIVSVGAAFHRLTLKKRLERAGHKVKEFEARYKMTLDQLEMNGLPDDAGYAMHEDYVEWHYWFRVSEQTRKTLDTLAVLAPENTLT